MSEREYELVVPVRLPEDMTPEEFLWHTNIEFSKGSGEGGRNPAGFRYSINCALEEAPEFLGPKELRGRL